MNNTDAMDDRAIGAALRCAQCGYDLRSQIATGNCPECNAPVSAAIVTPGLRMGSWQIVRRVRASLSILIFALLVHTLFAIGFVLVLYYWSHFTDRRLWVRLVRIMSDAPAYTEAAIAAGMLVFVIAAKNVPGVLRRWTGRIIIAWLLLVLAGHLSWRWVSTVNFLWLETWPNRVFAGLLWFVAGSSWLLVPLVPALLLRMLSPRATHRIRFCLWVGLGASLYFVAQAVVEMSWCAIYAATARPEIGWWGMGYSPVMPQQLMDAYEWFWLSERTFGAACWAVILGGVLVFLRASKPPSLSRNNGVARDDANHPKFGTAQTVSQSA